MDLGGVGEDLIAVAQNGTLQNSQFKIVGNKSTMGSEPGLRSSERASERMIWAFLFFSLPRYSSAYIFRYV
jgi:hypothetical protein